MRQKAAYLGPQGTFTQEAANCLLSEERYELIPYKTIPDCLGAADNGSVDIAVVPVENTIEGSVNLTLDWLAHQVDIPITGELVYPISQHLLVHPSQQDKALASYTKIISHPQALAQCQLFLREKMPQAEIEYANSTAEAARLISEHPEQSWVAIGNRLAKDIYGLSLRVESIEDHYHNYTRFIVVGEPAEGIAQEPVSQKTCILVTLPEDFPGALHQVLAAFAWRKINLSRIESRPTKKGLGSYHFFIDIEMGIDHVLLQGAVKEIEALGCGLRQLGSYPCYMHVQPENRIKAVDI